MTWLVRYVQDDVAGHPLHSRFARTRPLAPSEGDGHIPRIPFPVDSRLRGNDEGLCGNDATSPASPALVSVLWAPLVRAPVVGLFWASRRGRINVDSYL